MSECKLSICVAGLPGWDGSLLTRLFELMPEWCELIIDKRVDISIGSKRDSMVQRAGGDYICIIDLDDDVTDDYFDTLYEGIRKDVDAVCIAIDRQERKDGDLVRKYIHKFGYKNPHMPEAEQISPAGHFCAIKSNIVKSVGYKDLGRGEDFTHCCELIEHIKTAHYVDHPTYIQFFEDRKKEYDRYPKATAMQIPNLPLV